MALDKISESMLDEKFTQKVEKISEDLAQTEKQKVNKIDMANAPTPINLLTNYLHNQSVHPSIYEATTSFNGYKYWLGYTPYENGNDVQENPCLRASNDGVTWLRPTGVPDPIVKYPGTGWHQSDINITVKDNLMHLFFRKTSKTDVSNSAIYLITSSDCVTWSTAQEIPLPSGCVSPTFVYQNGEWHCWFVDLLDGYEMKYYKSTDLNTLTEVGESTFEINGYTNWHPEVRFYDGVYECLMSAYPSDKSNAYTELFHATSNDGLSWSLSNGGNPIIKPTANAWDSREIYKSTFLKNEKGYRIWYSAASLDNVWGIGFTEGEDVTNLIGKAAENPARLPNIVFEDWIRVYGQMIATAIRPMLRTDPLKLGIEEGAGVEIYGGYGESTVTPKIKISNKGELIFKHTFYHIASDGSLHIRSADGEYLRFNYGKGDDFIFYGGGTNELMRITKSGDVEFKQDGLGVIFKVGTIRYKLTVDSSGNLVTTQI